MKPTAFGEQKTGQRRLLFWIAFSLAVVFLQAIGMDYTLNAYDEGLTLYGALRVLHGQVPYRDFWTMYGPGQFYVFALLFKVLGVYAVWGRAFYVLTNVVTLAMMYSLALLLTGSRKIASAATLCGLIVLAGVDSPSYDFPIYQALALVMVASLLSMHAWREGSRRSMAGAGLAVGAAALFRHDMAFYAAVAILLANAWFYWADDRDGLPYKRRLMVQSGLFCAAILGVDLPATAWLVMHVPMHDLVYSLLYVPGKIYPKVRHLPFPTPLPLLRFVEHPGRLHAGGGSGLKQMAVDAIVYLPVIAVIAAAVCGLMNSKGRQARWQKAGYLLLILLVALMFLKGVVRVSPLHMAQAIVPAVLLLACTAGRWRSSGKTGRVLIVTAVALAILMLLVPLGYFAKRTVAVVRRIEHPSTPMSFDASCHPPPGLERATCLSVNPDDAQVALYLELHMAPDQTFFDGATRHDKLMANKIDLYFLSERESGTRWHDLHPGVETTQPIQQEIIRQMEENRAVYVVRDSFADATVEPNDSRFSSGVYDLDRYIDANYVFATRIGTMTILRRATPF